MRSLSLKRMADTVFATAQVAIENASYSYDKLYDYLIPDEMLGAAVPGCRVKVSFGHGLRVGMIMSLGTVTDKTGCKALSVLLDKEPVLSDELLSLAHFMKSHCFCTLYDACSAMLPTGLGMKLTYSYEASGDAECSLLTQEEKVIVSYLRARRKSIREDRLIKALQLDGDSLLRSLADRGFIIRTEDIKHRMADDTVKMVRLCSSPPDRKYTPQQSEVIQVLSDIGEVSVKELCYFTGCSVSVADNLVKKGICEYFEAPPPRPAVVQEQEIPQDIILTEEQDRAYRGLLGKLEEGKPNVSLLYGVTGSGKTSVFMKLIDRVSESGRGVIMMVPEISLTPQLLSKFKARYKNRVAVFHSALSLGKRLEEWKRVKNSEATIAVGTRSAIFAPLSDIGLIVMDEEQEYSYKSSANPRFHARELAKFRCSRAACTLVLCSATPSVESYKHALDGRYSLFTLGSRYGKAVLPHVVTVDMNRDRDQGNTSIYSSVLLEAIDDNLKEGHQSIILLNRRGHNTYVACRSCSETISCPNCSISMTYHSANDRLMCHYCGHSIPLPGKCPSCGSDKLRFGGSGTQRAQQQLQELFPKARLLRLDTDSTMRRYSFDRKLSAFRDGEYDIMLGTQMVAKGLDFPDVTLVGVLSADSMMHSDDFRSYERTFALLTQVVGRSGRGGLEGRAVIQSFEPDNPVIELAAAQDYDEFFKTEISLRRSMLYPPFADIGMAAFISEDKKSAYQSACLFTKRLGELARERFSKLPLRVIGPSPAGIQKIGGKFRYKLIIKYRGSSDFRMLMSELLTEVGKSSRGVSIYFDTDPENIL